jgi:hypothetical protein
LVERGYGNGLAKVTEVDIQIPEVNTFEVADLTAVEASAETVTAEAAETEVSAVDSDIVTEVEASAVAPETDAVTE